MTENGAVLTPFEKNQRGDLPILLYEPPFSKGGNQRGDLPLRDKARLSESSNS